MNYLVLILGTPLILWMIYVLVNDKYEFEREI